MIAIICRPTDDNIFNTIHFIHLAPYRLIQLILLNENRKSVEIFDPSLGGCDRINTHREFHDVRETKIHSISNSIFSIVDFE